MPNNPNHNLNRLLTKTSKQIVQLGTEGVFQFVDIDFGALLCGDNLGIGQSFCDCFTDNTGDEFPFYIW